MINASGASLCAIALVSAWSLWVPSASAAVHLWHIVEVFSNHDGSVQFIELQTSSGGETQTDAAQLQATSNGVTKTFTISGNLVGSTANKRLLFATPSFSSRPGGITPNYTLPAGPFFDPNATGSVVITFSSPLFGLVDTVSFTAASLPKNGVQSLSFTEGGATSVVTNSPTNFAGAVGQVNQPPPLPRMASCGLVGGWLLAESGEFDPVVVTLTRDGKFILAETDDLGPPGGQNGMERGTYNVNPSSGALAVSLVQDTNGTWGISQAGPIVLSLQGNTLLVTESGSEMSSFSRVASVTDPIVGSWILEEGGNTAVITFLADGRYMFAQDGPPDGFGQPGMERGTYTWNPTTGAFSSMTEVNTDLEWGLSNGFPQFVTVNGNTMTFSDDGTVLTRVTPSPGCEGKDVDGDGRADVVWRNASTGENYFYPMNGIGIGAGEGYLPRVADLNWKIAGTGDFDGDGKADIFWRNTSTGQNYVFLMNGRAILNEGYVQAVADTNWEVVGVGDFNGDGKDDVLWRNTVTGENYIYPMNGLAVLPSEGYLPTVASHHWQVAGIGKFDAGPTADILWRNSRTGENYIFLMNGTTITGEGFISTVAALEWQIAGVGDLDGDGMADILWRNVASGENYLYPMNGMTILGTENYLPTVSDLNWRIAGVADYDGDGRADVLWRNAASGDNYVFLMQGTTVAGEGYLPNVADQNWKPRHSSPFAIRRGPVDGTQVPFETAASGTTWARMDLFTREMSGIIQTTGLTGAFAAHIHLGARGQNGGIIVNYAAQGGNDWVPVEAMPSANYVHFLTGGTYVNVHTPARSAGEIRGQLE